MRQEEQNHRAWGLALCSQPAQWSQAGKILKPASGSPCVTWCNGGAPVTALS